jgi:hypothetical protein
VWKRLLQRYNQDYRVQADRLGAIAFPSRVVAHSVYAAR